jgi:trehalose 6-phosphate phosphatase
VIDAGATIAALAEHPERTAVLVDFDGSLAPIVEHAQDARPLPEAVDVLGRLARRMGRVAVVSGRPVDFLARHLRVDGVTLVGHYGLERMVDGEVEVDPRVRPYLPAVAAAVADVEARLPRALVEPKSGLSVVLHWRPAPEMEATIVGLARECAARHGLVELPARHAIELRPPVDLDKADAARVMTDGFDVAAFAGDDIGDLPAFAELAAAVARGRLVRAVRIGVHSSEAPPELAAAVDVLVDGPHGLVALLARLADEIGEPVGG